VAALPRANSAEAARPGFVVMGLLTCPGGRPRAPETFGVAFTAHAIGRLLDRSGFRADPVAAMLEAHGALTHLDPEDGERIYDLQTTVELPAAGGAFLTTPGRFGPRETPLAIARTWVDGDQLHADQAGKLAKWRALLELENAP
jgi:hypothetical protein